MVKNLKAYVTPDEVRAFVDSILLTDEMREAFRSQTALTELLDQYCRYPRLSFEASDDVVERGNFTSWYNALALRKYENPAVNDLFYLHEITHIATMPYLPDAGFDGWRRKMFRNELEASVMSEAFIYFLSPALRKRSFAGDIWVDRFTGPLKDQGLGGILVLLLGERDRIQRSPHPDDAQEMRIFSYQKQNDAWAQIWKSKYPVIERRMSGFYQLAAIDPARAAADLIDWLKNEIAAGGKAYPFATEVEAFADYCAKDKTAVIPSELNLKKKT